MRAREFLVLSQAVDNGVQRGWNRAHKHDGEPPDDTIMDEIRESVINEICEWFIFEDEVEDEPKAEG